jgi:DNA-binding MarR family transcriptional regulator
MLTNIMAASSAAWRVLIERVEAFLLIPGEFVASWLREAVPSLAASAGLDAASSGVWLSGIVSAVFWIAALWTLYVVVRLLRDLDRALTRWLVNCSYAVVVKLRTIRTFTVCTLRRLRRGAPESPWGTAQQVELSTLEGALLRAQLRTIPGSVSSARDLAVDLAVSARQAKHALDRLSKLGLVETTAAEGAQGYRLTRSGRLFTEAHAAR